MMQKTHEAAAVIPIAQERQRLEQLVECNQLLDAVQKGLAAYLEKKRLFFPRCCPLSATTDVVIGTEVGGSGMTAAHSMPYGHLSGVRSSCLIISP
jgi:hypothetical protein